MQQGHSISDLNNTNIILPPHNTSIHQFHMCNCMFSEWWSTFRHFLRITTGFLFISVGLYDFIKPGVENTGAGTDLRDPFLDILFILFGGVLSISTVKTSLFNTFGFMKTNFGGGIFILFTGALVIKSFDLGQYRTLFSLSFLLSCSTVLTRSFALPLSRSRHANACLMQNPGLGSGGFALAVYLF